MTASVVIALLLASTALLSTKPSAYGIRALPDRSVDVTRGSMTERFRPHFTVIRAEADPEMGMTQAFSDPRQRKQMTDPEAYPLPSWQKPGSEERTDVLFEAGTVTTVEAEAASETPSGAIQWTFPKRSDFELQATIEPAGDGKEPILSFRFTPQRAGWYTIGYTGAPETDPATADGFWQPLVWQEKRFPRAPLLTAEFMTILPATLVSRGGATLGLATDPKESPYRLPNIDNSRFGVMLRNPAGHAQPMVFAPLFGKAGSRMEAGQPFTFRMRPVLVNGDWYAAFRHIAESLFEFRDLRENTAHSLNDTLTNMIDFAMDDQYSGWVPDLKGFDYASDVTGTVKVVSALHPLSTALVRDDPEIYRRRALPVTEYLMSREKYLFSVATDIEGQGASHNMNGPSAEVSELAELFHVTRERSPVFHHYALEMAKKPRALNLDMISETNTFQNNLALYRLTREQPYLDTARQLADAYVEKRIQTPQADFTDVHVETGGQFWTDFAPKWVDLFELYEETGDQRYLQAATRGAERYASFCWLYPTVPPGHVTVDQGNKAPIGWGYRGRNFHMQTPEQTVPAWRVSQIGLTPEASTTFQGNPAVLLTHYAAFFLRIAKASKDPFLRAVARSAVVGRYANYPGYDINVEFSNIYARADYPMRPFGAFSYNQVYYNHVWPHIALLIDYLVSDVDVRSDHQITFPSRYAQGYAYLQSKVYGDRPGTFYGDSDVRLWMPRQVVSISDPQINYLSGYGNDNFYLALTNESPRPSQATIQLNSEYLPYSTGKPYRVRLWRDGKSSKALTAVDGAVTVPVSPRGLTALVIEQMPVFTRLHASYFDQSAKPLSPESHHVQPTEFGNVTGMLISMGREMTNGFIWLQASEKQITSATLHYRTDPSWVSLVDDAHPFEFSLPVSDEQSAFEYYVEVSLPDGGTARTETTRLMR
ncbi:MAG: hypothetical protein GEU99_12545 [Luteitalea sp.]|nr:hypothetical protein [Luteitalea sp.]